jgi:hypothetical protein
MARKLPQVLMWVIAFGSTGCFGSGNGEGQDTTPPAGGTQAAATTPPGEPAATTRPSQDGSASLSWNPPTENADGSTMSDLAGYRIYYGKSPKKLNKTIVIDNPGLTRYVVENLAAAKWHFSMTSVNSSGKESARSKTVSKKIA